MSKNPANVIDPSELSIVNEVYTDGRSLAKSKYDGIFTPWPPISAWSALPAPPVASPRS